jgi:polyisoprenoid-binding protein YceI
MKHLTIVLAALLAGLFSQPAAAADRFAMDKVHTNIAFLINHLGYSNMLGQFQEFEGEFLFDQQTITNSRISLTIQTASIDTDHEARDKHLRSPDFFNALEFPTMTFTSTGIEKTGDNSGRVTGDLTLLGTTRPVTLDVTFNKMAPHPIAFYKGVMVAGFSARGTVKRSAFGMKYGLPNLGDEITLILEVEGHRK